MSRGVVACRFSSHPVPSRAGQGRSYFQQLGRPLAALLNPVLSLRLARAFQYLTIFRARVSLVQNKDVQSLQRCVDSQTTEQAKVEHVAQMQHEVPIQVPTKELFPVAFQEQVARQRYLTVTYEPIFHDMQVPQLHQLLLPLIDIRELIDHHFGFGLQPLGVFLIVTIRIHFLRENWETGDCVMVQSVMSGYDRPMSVSVHIIRKIIQKFTH